MTRVKPPRKHVRARNLLTYRTLVLLACVPSSTQPGISGAELWNAYLARGGPEIPANGFYTLLHRATRAGFLISNGKGIDRIYRRTLRSDRALREARKVLTPKA